MNQWVSDLQQLTQMIKPSSPIKEQNEDDRQDIIILPKLF